MTVLPRLDYSTSGKSETRRARKFDHNAAADARAAGYSWRVIAHHFGVDRSALRQAVLRVPESERDAARSPIMSPSVGDTSSLPAAVNGRLHASGDETDGLRGAPAGTVHPPAREGKEQILVEAGAPIVRRQLDEHGDTIYVLSLPAAHYVTHARSLVDELLQPFEPSVVRWINEED